MDLGLLPGGRQMAAPAVVHPAQTRVVGHDRAREIALVARRALRIRGHELADLAARVAAPALRDRVHARQRQTRVVVQLDHAERLPAGLLVAARALRAEAAEVAVLVATAAALRGETPGRSAVVVAAQAQRARV